MSKKYKWASPHDWLIAKISRHNDANEVSELVSICQDLVGEVDNDTIQDMYQSEMDADGYFDSEDESSEDTQEEE